MEESLNMARSIDYGERFIAVVCDSEKPLDQVLWDGWIMWWVCGRVDIAD